MSADPLNWDVASPYVEKIEVRADHTRPMDMAAYNIVAIAADQSPPEGDLPWFARDDVGAIADFIAGQLGRHH